MFLMAEPLRNLGRFTFADVASYRLQATPIRALAATGTLVTVAFYLIAQMVGAGQLIQLLFGLPYLWAVVIVGVLMVIYVTFGGMIATTWVQIIKAGLLLSGSTIMALLVLAAVRLRLHALIAKAVEVHPSHEKILLPGSAVGNPINAFSLGMALMFGTAGLPHILMRFFTVGNAKEARKSVFWATTFIGYFYILTFIIGFGAIVLVVTNPIYHVGGDIKAALIGGGNMPAIHLAHAVGGDLMKGFIAAVAFATILAVVSGLTLSGASAVSHDLYASVFRHGNVAEGAEVRVSRITTIILGIVAIILGVVFEKINAAFMVGLAFAVAASANFPVLFLSMLWKGLTTRGAAIGGWVGLVSAVLLTIVSPGVWEAVFGYPKGSALFPYVIAGHLHDPAVVFLLLAVLGDRQFEDRNERTGGVRCPICPLADGDRRRRRRRPLAVAAKLLARRWTRSGRPRRPLRNDRRFPAKSRHKREGPLLSGTALPLSRHAKLVGALEFLPSERYARNSFAGAITQASSITRGVRQ